MRLVIYAAVAVILGIFAGMIVQAFAQPTNLAPFQRDVTVGTTAVMAAVPANPTRKGLMLCNTGATGQTIYVTFGTLTPVAGNGVPLQSTGAFATACLNLMPYMGPNIAMGAQINAIASAAATPLTALEF